MAFSFNWSGLTIPTINPIKPEVDMNQVGKDLGRGVRGWQDRKASDEYADLIDEYMANEEDADAADDQEIAEIEAEIERLEMENAQLQQVVDAKVPDEQSAVAAAAQGGPQANEMIYNWASTFDPKTASVDQIKQMQSLVGTTPDGKWGPKSSAAYQTYMNSIGVGSYGPNL